MSEEHSQDDIPFAITFVNHADEFGVIAHAEKEVANASRIRCRR